QHLAAGPAAADQQGDKLGRQDDHERQPGELDDQSEIAENSFVSMVDRLASMDFVTACRCRRRGHCSLLQFRPATRPELRHFSSAIRSASPDKSLALQTLTHWAGAE